MSFLVLESDEISIDKKLEAAFFKWAKNKSFGKCLKIKSKSGLRRFLCKTNYRLLMMPLKWDFRSCGK